MSASDLAPFVAATLRDKVVNEMSEENRQLREENERLRAEVNVLRRTPTAELTAGDGTVCMRGTFERRACLDSETACCTLETCGNPTVSSIPRCKLEISGISWGEVSGDICYAEWARDQMFPAVLTTFGRFELKVYFEVDSREEFLSFLGVHRRSSEEYFYRLNLKVDDVVSAFPEAKIKLATIWVDAKDMIMHGPENGVEWL